MRAYIVTTFVGCFGVDEHNQIILVKPFPKDPVKIAKKLVESEFKIIDEEKQIQKELWKRKYNEFVYSVRKEGARIVEPGNKAEQFVKENLRDIAIKKKIVKDQTEFNNLLTKVNIELTKIKIRQAIGRDNLIIQINGAIEELDKSINIFAERLREFYSLHFPEMDRIVKDHKKYAKIVEKFGSRERIDEPELKDIAAKSMGANFTPEDIRVAQSFAREIIQLYNLRDTFSNYLEKLLKEVAPNLSTLATPAIAAKLIAKAGGIEKLAKSPSSFIQLIGAEKALFRFLHGKGKTPRFGILAIHPLVQQAPEKLKGRIARALALKLSMAAKIDFYSKEYKGEKLKKELEERIKEILSSKK